MEYLYDILENDFSCTFSSIPNANNSTDFHMHYNYEIYLFMGGDVDYFIENKRYHLHKGDLLIFNSHEIHKSVNLSGAPYNRYMIHFNPSIVLPFNTSRTNLLSCFQYTGHDKKNIIRLEDSDYNLILSAYKEIDAQLKSNKYGDDVSPLLTLIRLLIKLNLIFKEKNDFPAFIDQGISFDIMNYINTHLSDELSLDKLSKQFLIDKHHLCKLFKQSTGGTIHKYISMKRITYARKLLINGCTVTDACAMSGFGDYANFIRQFKSVTGMSPGKYAKSMTL